MSFTVHNTNSDEVRNEITYNLRNTAGVTVLNRGNPTQGNQLLLSDFNTIHYYQYSGEDALRNFDISTLMLEDAVYEVKFNCSGSSISNNDLFLTPNFGNYSSSNFYTIYLNSYDVNPDGEASTRYKSSLNNYGFYVDFFDGTNGYDPVGKITIYNRRSCKKVLIEAGDTASSTTASGYWLNNSTESQSYSPNSETPPSYNLNTIWSSVGRINFIAGSFKNWSIYVSRVG
jgi:hypothetical protein